MLDIRWRESRAGRTGMVFGFAGEASGIVLDCGDRLFRMTINLIDQTFRWRLKSKSLQITHTVARRCQGQVKAESRAIALILADSLRESRGAKRALTDVHRQPQM